MATTRQPTDFCRDYNDGQPFFTDLCRDYNDVLEINRWVWMKRGVLKNHCYRNDGLRNHA